MGLESGGPGRTCTGPAHPRHGAHGNWCQTTLTSEARWSGAAAGRRGMQHPGPSDQVGIDGPVSSSSSDGWTGVETLEQTGGVPRLTWGPSPVTRTRLGEAALSGELNEGRQWRLFFWEADLHVGDESDHCGLRWGSVLASLDQGEG
jgi:hypothetical protein